MTFTGYVMYTEKQVFVKKQTNKTKQNMRLPLRAQVEQNVDGV